jgi:N-acyl homoserine lactone hydrolase
MLTLLTLALVSLPLAARHPAPKTLRLYVIDCGILKVDDPSRFNFKKEEVAFTDLSVGCYLISHPKGNMIWDTGAVPDANFKQGGGPATKEYGTANVPLKTQLARAGFTPEDIKYTAISHFHWDHIANVYEFPKSTWLLTKVEYDVLMGSDASKLPVRTDPSMFVPLKKMKTTFLPNSDYDVFGDGTVIIKPAVGHTPGHRVLYLKLAKTGPVVLAGDLYHYPEELTMPRAMQGDVVEQTMASRANVQAFLKQSGAQLWIQHDLGAFRKLKKLPEWYE